MGGPQRKRAASLCSKMDGKSEEYSAQQFVDFKRLGSRIDVDICQTLERSDYEAGVQT